MLLLVGSIEIPENSVCWLAWSEKFCLVCSPVVLFRGYVGVYSRLFLPVRRVTSCGCVLNLSGARV